MAKSTDGRASPTIVSLDALTLSAQQIAEIDAIFFGASATRSFPSEAARQAFRERWLGRYLTLFPHDALIALDNDGMALGYLVGARHDPATDGRFADIGYFAELADVTPLYPAHLHINLAEADRSGGIGTRLVATFCTHLLADGVPGVHVVTGAHSRNRSFYDRLGFTLVRELDWNGTAIVMLGKPLWT